MALFVSCKDVPISQQTKNACSDQLHSSTVNSYAPICRMQQCIALHICRVETIPASRSSANPHKQLAVDLFWECHMLSCRDLMSHCGKHCVIISEATLGFFIGSHFLRLRCPYRSTSTGAQVGSLRRLQRRYYLLEQDALPFLQLHVLLSQRATT